MTGRLIDADAIEYSPLDDIYNRDVMVAFKESIENMPTVDAIPISWINDWHDRYNYAEVGDLLNDWASERKDDDRKID